MMQPLIYRNFFVTMGTGESNSHRILAFDRALMTAGINQCNLVPVSSMLPVGAQRISQSVGLIGIGEMVFCVLARAEAQRGFPCYAGIAFALGFSKDSHDKYGFVLEGVGEEGEEELKARLAIGINEMAELRNFSVEHSDVIVAGIPEVFLNYGCTIVALVYRP